ncbi:hypothetical protein FB45DRAFT_868873 [Roridomyces roridus]|uniref:Uncharacterized protein n=1 Tax=Roridomyces roridus TaxID=1738132 RepID=A0AAD7BMS0_9AGAR|nr:hypothetical protein FB45DRAFT_868873 [Roridomyces roridus]
MMTFIPLAIVASLSLVGAAPLGGYKPRPGETTATAHPSGLPFSPEFAPGPVILPPAMSSSLAIAASSIALVPSSQSMAPGRPARWVRAGVPIATGAIGLVPGLTISLKNFVDDLFNTVGDSAPGAVKRAHVPSMVGHLNELPPFESDLFDYYLDHLRVILTPTSDMQPAAPCYSTATGENSVIGNEGCRVGRTESMVGGGIGNRPNGISRERWATALLEREAEQCQHDFYASQSHIHLSRNTSRYWRANKGGDTPCNDVKEREVAITGAQAAAIKKFRRERGGAAAMRARIRRGCRATGVEASSMSRGRYLWRDLSDGGWSSPWTSYTPSCEHRPGFTKSTRNKIERMQR